MSTHIQRSALLPYPTCVLFSLVNGVKCYSEFLPQCSASQILKKSGNLMRTEPIVAKGSLSQCSTTRNMLVPRAPIEMNLENGPFTELHGVWQLKALDEKVCKITLDLTFDYVEPLIKAAFGPLFTQAANTMADAFCQRIE